jgi:ribosomal-protein-alanine N-acetyltransferase
MLPKIDPLRSKRLLLEARKEQHAYELYNLFCDKDLYDYTMRDIPPCKEWLANGFKIAERLTSEDKKQIWLGWVGKKLETLEPIGLFEMTIENGEAFVAYTVFKKYWGQGYAVEATQAMLDYVTNNYQILRFIIEMDTRNRSSVKVAEKLGFEFVKVKNNAAFLKGLVSHEFQYQKLV